MSSRRIQKLIAGIAITVIGLTMGLGGAAAYGATPSAKGQTAAVHGEKTKTAAKHHKKTTRKHTKKRSHKKHRKAHKKASHKHHKHTVQPRRA